VYDVAIGGANGPPAVHNFSGNILPGRITYGDLAVLRRGNQFDFYMTGVSVNTAFVMRFRLLPNGTTVGPQVLVASSLTTAGTVNQPRGVAVNANGTVITTLPAIAGPTGAIDSLVAFSADFVPGAGSPPAIGRGQFDFTSRGMTTDTAGNFYVATGAVGTSVCGVSGSGALVFLSANLATFRCLNLNAILALSEDVAISPANDRAYMTLDTGQVILFRLQ
jgi:hypothetical protein